jgi:hypothetical protein
VVVSCENEIPYKANENPSKMVLNALFNANSKTNPIILSLTGQNQIGSIKNASVDLYINGELADRINEPDSILKNKALLFNTDLAVEAGDKLKMEVKTDDNLYHIWTEEIVPKPTLIEKIDTTIVTENSIWNDLDKFLRVKTTFSDDGQTMNYYRIVMDLNLTIATKNPTTNADTTIYRTITQSLSVNEDIVLTDGHPSAVDDNGLLTPNQNIWGVFDNSRIHGEYTMTTSLRIPYSVFPYYGINADYTLDKNIKKITTDVIVKLQKITQTQYLYLKALNIYDSMDEDNYFSQPVKFPSNIQGGTGIFGISISDEATIRLADYIP